MATAIRTCSVEGCDRKHFGHGYCFMHYKRLKTTGSLELIQRDRTAEALAAFHEKYTIDPPSGCWVWQRYLDPAGYGRMHVAGDTVLAHRWIYEQTNGSIDSELSLDHLCRNRACVNPAHLEPVSRGENVRRGKPGQWKRADVCKRGHEFTAENTYIWAGRPTERHCRACAREKARRAA